ncbi:MAG TPA: hypothetical protein VFO19_10765 [Vicinamibacterales bacterium]|nr:hypothetical protein [Vicinamibacterales bacterium]
MAIRYRNRARRYERMLSRIENTRRTIAGHRQSALEQEAWWRRHGGTLDAWRSAVAEQQHRQLHVRPTVEADRFRRWTSRLRWHPAMLRLRLQCWWLSLRLAVRGRGRGPTR